MKTIEIYHDLLKLSNIANTFVESMVFDVIIYRNFSQKADSSPVSRTKTPDTTKVSGVFLMSIDDDFPP